MAQIAFHFGASDKLAYACRLLRKAAASGARVVAVADGQLLDQLDAELWAVGATDFVSHCGSQAPQATKERSAVVLVQDLAQAGAAREVLVNLGDTVPVGFEDFDRVIDVVSVDDEDRSHGRQRWKQYIQLGYAIARHDLVAKGATV
jgi:DNA polymerase III subunit chi